MDKKVICDSSVLQKDYDDEYICHTIGVGRYLQGRGSLKLLGKEILRFGQNAFLLGDTGGLTACGSEIGQILAKHNVKYYIQKIKTECSIEARNIISKLVIEKKWDVVIGVGGGKCIDLAKSVAALSDLPIITIPTIAATCAGWTPLSIMYHPDGKPDSGINHTYSVNCCIVDTEVILHAPARTLASGISDSLAKHQEIMCGNKFLKCEDSRSSFYSAYQIAKAIDDILYQKGKEAYQSVCLKQSTQAFEDVVYVNIALTGICSGLVAGTGQLVLAHAFNDAVHEIFLPQALEHLHGEIVGVGNIIQMHANQVENIIPYKRFCRTLNLPTTVSELGIEPIQINWIQIFDYLIGKLKDQEKNISIDRLKSGLNDVFEIG